MKPHLAKKIIEAERRVSLARSPRYRGDWQGAIPMVIGVSVAIVAIVVQFPLLDAVSSNETAEVNHVLRRTLLAVNGPATFLSLLLHTLGCPVPFKAAMVLYWVAIGVALWRATDYLWNKVR